MEENVIREPVRITMYANGIKRPIQFMSNIMEAGLQ
jgi:hypothetical protein